MKGRGRNGAHQMNIIKKMPEECKMWTSSEMDIVCIGQNGEQKLKQRRTAHKWERGKISIKLLLGSVFFCHHRLLPSSLFPCGTFCSPSYFTANRSCVSAHVSALSVAFCVVSPEDQKKNQNQEENVYKTA